MRWCGFWNPPASLRNVFFSLHFLQAIYRRFDTVLNPRALRGQGIYLLHRVVVAIRDCVVFILQKSMIGISGSVHSRGIIHAHFQVHLLAEASRIYPDERQLVPLISVAAEFTNVLPTNRKNLKLEFL